jgi:putative restriction endonuclease
MSIGNELLDMRMREAAFQHVRLLNATRDHLTSSELAEGFMFEGERIPLVNPQRGIFKPHQMRYLLSIRTVFPRAGAKVWYDDQRHVHSQLYESKDFVDYAFMGKDPDAADNRWLREAFENQIPIIYFIGIAPGRFTAIIPSYIGGWHRETLKASIGFGDPSTFDETRFPDTEPARRYALRTVQQRLHQASFRQAVIAAYDSRCALSGLPEPLLLDAAHIVSDRHEVLGQPVVPNGIPLSKIHHAAFDAHLIGIDPDFRMHVSARLLEQSDGPMLEAIKGLDKQKIRLPTRVQDRPDRDRLAVRFETFRARA